LNEIPFQRPTEEEERAMLAQFLIAFGAALWSFLGTIHIIYTFFTNKLEPRDAATTAAMKTTNPVLTRRTNLWNGWIGFNASFGLGLLLFGTTYLLLAVGHMSLLRESPALTWLPVVGGRRSTVGNRRPILLPPPIHWCRDCHSEFPGGRIGARERHTFAEIRTKQTDIRRGKCSTRSRKTARRSVPSFSRLKSARPDNSALCFSQTLKSTGRNRYRMEGLFVAWSRSLVAGVQPGSPYSRPNRKEKWTPELSLLGAMMW
jgi:hypothetical protein